MKRICKTCLCEKELDKFVNQNGIYRNKCKECKNNSRRTGKLRSSFKKGNIPWNKGLKERTSKNRIYKPLSDDSRKKISESKIGTICSEEHREKLRQNWINKNLPAQRRNRRYIEWRAAVLKRDNYECEKCKSKENLHVHHIVPYDECPEKRIDVDNGLTLCRHCHLSLEHKGKLVSKETCEKISLGKTGKLNSWLGRKHTEESKKKMSDKKTGNKIPNYPKIENLGFR